MGDKELKEKKSKKKLDVASPRPEPTIVLVPVAASGSGTQRLDVSACPVEFVTVYNDRAEVTRLVSVNLKRGASEVVIYGISRKVDEASIRVSGGVGKATILEVKHAIKPRKSDDKQDEELAKKSAALKENEKQKEQLKEQINIVTKEREWLQAYSQSLHAPAPVEGKIARLSFAEAAEFMGFYQQTLANLNKQERELSKRIEDLNESDKEIERSRTKAAELVNARLTPDQCEVTVALEASENTEVSLHLSYILLDARWYDVRVSSSSTQMQLTYYGVIHNNTTEDWNETRLSLSTAVPSVGGSPPKMNTLIVQPAVRRAAVPMYGLSSNSMAVQSFSPRRRDTNTNRLSVNPMMSNEFSAGEDMPMPAPPPNMTVLTSNIDVKSNSTTFSIPRKATVQSDNEPHKVTIAVIELESRFTYTVLPKLSPHAYLRATCDNTSAYPLLDGVLNVFMDNNFVTSSTLKSTNPGEEFFVHLGVDSSIQVDFKPPKCVTATSGFMTKTMKEDHKYVTVLKNTKPIDVSVHMFMQCPKSETDKIKVKIVEPAIKEGEREGDVTLNEFNNVRWLLKVPSKKEKIVVFNYTLEYGSDLGEVQYV